MATITTVTQRTKLAVRRAPYWQKIGTGSYLGFRRTDRGGTWLARYYGGTYGKQQYHSLGDLADYPDNTRYARAMELARQWTAHLAQGGSSRAFTVRDACAAYVQKKAREGGDQLRSEIEDRLARLVLHEGSKIADVPLLKLTHRQMAEWRQELEKSPALVSRSKRAEGVTRSRSPGTVNRDMVPFRAALNLALENGDVLADVAWRKALKPNKNADRRKEVYLDREQRSTLLSFLTGDIDRFARALCLLPLRPGAVAKLTVGDYDSRKQELRVKLDKAGRDRRILLPAATNAFVAEAASGRADDRPLFARSNGEAWDKDAWKKPIRAAAKEAQLPEGVSAYTLRHSTITDLVVGGLDMLTVAQISGTSAVMIEKHYGHLQKHRAADALAGLALQ